MARPAGSKNFSREGRSTPVWVYRVRIDRPERGDSRVIWVTQDIDEIRKKYGNKVLTIDRYGYERSFHAKG